VSLYSVCVPPPAVKLPPMFSGSPARSNRTRTLGIGALFAPRNSARISERLAVLLGRLTATTLGFAETEAETIGVVTFGTVLVVCTWSVWTSEAPPMPAVIVYEPVAAGAV
jgi:hypothetical protein